MAALHRRHVTTLSLACVVLGWHSVNVTWSNIRIETQYHAPRWWGNGEWLGITSLPRSAGDRVGTMRHLRFVNITGRSENGGLLSSLQGGGVHDVVFENVHIRIAAWSNYSQTSDRGTRGPVGPGWPAGVMCGEDPVICSTDNRTCAGPGNTLAPPPPPRARSARQLLCLGTRDYRPHNGGACSYYCRTPSKAHGLYVENVHGLTLKNFTIEYELPRRSWFGDCLVVDNRSTGIVGAASIRCINGPVSP